jgi:hypothetical protein
MLRFVVQRPFRFLSLYGWNCCSFVLAVQNSAERPKTNAPRVLDVLDQPIFCCGDWRYPGKSNQFLPAITQIHNSINQERQYFPVCDACVEANQHVNNSCCRRHPGQFLVWRRGNPRCSEKVRNALQTATELCKGHAIKGSYQLQPQEVRDFLTNLTSSGKYADLQLFCILLTSTYLFLWHDECHKIKVEDIRPEYAAVEQKKIVDLWF